MTRAAPSHCPVDRAADVYFARAFRSLLFSYTGLSWLRKENILLRRVLPRMYENKKRGSPDLIPFPFFREEDLASSRRSLFGFGQLSQGIHQVVAFVNPREDFPVLEFDANNVESHFRLNRPTGRSRASVTKRSGTHCASVGTRSQWIDQLAHPFQKVFQLFVGINGRSLPTFLSKASIEIQSVRKGYCFQPFPIPRPFPFNGL